MSDKFDCCETYGKPKSVKIVHAYIQSPLACLLEKFNQPVSIPISPYDHHPRRHPKITQAWDARVMELYGPTGSYAFDLAAGLVKK